MFFKFFSEIFRIVKAGFVSVIKIGIQIGEIKVFPNSVTEGNNITIGLNILNNYSVKLIDEAGKVVLSETYPSTQNISLSTGGISKGIYFVIVYSSSGKQVAKSSVIIE